MNKARVIIVDDNQDRRESVEMLINIQSDMECVATLHDAVDILASLSQYKADVVLMDIDMPIINGIDALKMIRASHHSVKVIMQTVFEDEAKITQAICSGANGYILKKTEPLKLIEGIREVMQGGAPLTPSVASFLLQIIQVQPAESHVPLPSFTAREKEVLKLMVEGQSYKMISEKLHVSIFTVNAHIRNIYDKMQVKSMTEAVALAIKNKFV